MKDLKPLLKIILVFGVLYIGLILVYNSYLNHYFEGLESYDPFTFWVAEQSSWLLNVLGFDSQTIHVAKQNFVWIYLDNQYASMVNEGCNALSVMILYVAFIVAFAQKWWKTLVFILVTLLLIHLTNIIRVAWLNYIFRYLPEYGKISHDYIFPAIVYGVIVVFWLIWMKFFVLKKTPKS